MRDRLTHIGYPSMLVLMMAWLLLVPALERLPFGALLLTATYLAILSLGLFLATPRGRLRPLVGGGIGLLAVTTLIPTSYGSVALAAATILNLFYVFYVPVAMVRQFSRTHVVTGDVILGAAAAYVLMGIAWGFTYTLVEQTNPGSFWFAARLPGDPSVLYYFSFATITTLGYGDVTPVSAGVRTLASLEALVGQLYLVVLVARLVSLHTAHDLERERSRK